MGHPGFVWATRPFIHFLNYLRINSKRIWISNTKIAIDM